MTVLNSIMFEVSILIDLDSQQDGHHVNRKMWHKMTFDTSLALKVGYCYTHVLDVNQTSTEKGILR